MPAARPRLPTADRLLPYLRRIDDSRTYSNWGPLCSELETRLAQRLSLPSGGLTVAASGTSALTGAVLASAGRASADRPFAIVPAFTFPATASAVECCGYVPYLVDVDADTWLLDPQRVLRHAALDRVGVVVPVATFGRPPPETAWRTFRDATQIPVVIDGAASFDRFVDAERAELGEIPVAMSFHATKSFSAGEGGAVASSDIELVARTAQALNLGFRGTRESCLPGINGKLNEYQAAVGLAELDAWTEKHAALRVLADRYRSLLSERGQVSRIVATPDIGATYVLFACSGEAEAAAVRTRLTASGVGHRLWYERGLQHHSAFAEAPRDDLPVTERLAPLLVGIPVAPDLSEASIVSVVDALIRGISEDGA